jgi:hypothetical protein
LRYAYEFTISQVFKTNANLEAGSIFIITSDVALSMCGGYIPEEIEYLDVVNSGSVSNCGLSKPWADVSEEDMKKGFGGSCDVSSASGLLNVLDLVIITLLNFIVKPFVT